MKINIVDQRLSSITCEDPKDLLKLEKINFRDQRLSSILYEDPEDFPSMRIMSNYE